MSSDGLEQTEPAKRRLQTMLNDGALTRWYCCPICGERFDLVVDAEPRNQKEYGLAVAQCRVAPGVGSA